MEDNNEGRKRKGQEHRESVGDEEEEEEEEEQKIEEFYALIRSTRDMREYLMRRSQDTQSTHQHHRSMNHHDQGHKVSASFNQSFQPEDFTGYSSAKEHLAGTSNAIEREGQRKEEQDHEEKTKKKKKEDEDGGINHSPLDLNLSL